jgi:hypothetical protein
VARLVAEDGAPSAGPITGPMSEKNRAKRSRSQLPVSDAPDRRIGVSIWVHLPIEFSEVSEGMTRGYFDAYSAAPRASETGNRRSTIERSVI